MERLLPHLPTPWTRLWSTLLFLLFSLATFAQSRPFITTWTITTANESIVIPTDPAIAGYNYTVDWGDGRSDAGQTGDASHTYASPGTYQVSITGSFPAIQIVQEGSPNAEKLTSIEQWGDISWHSMASAFSGASNMVLNATDAPDLSRVTSLEKMFFGASSFNGDLSGWDVSAITNMSNLFYNASAFNGNISGWNVANVTNMSAMFMNAVAFDQDIGSWNVSQVTDMSYMFYQAAAFNQDLSAWSVSNVTTMEEMFFNAQRFDQSLGDWDISKVTNMNNMLRVSGLSPEHYSATLIGWAGKTVVSGVTLDASGLAYCPGTAAADARQQLISKGWTIIDDGVAADCGDIGGGGGITPGDPGNFVTTWKTTAANESITIPINPSVDGYDYIVDWGDGSTPTHYAKENATHTYAAAGDHTVTITGNFPAIHQPGPKLISIDQWGDIAWETMEEAFMLATNMEINASDVPDLSRVTSTARMFRSATNFSADLSDWDVSAVQNMQGMFQVATSFNGDLSGWVPSSVTNMEVMFQSAEAFNRDLSGWDVSSVQNMQGMFMLAVAFNGDLSGWETSSVTNMISMFEGATAFNQDLSGWDVSAVTNMSAMFSNATAFNGDVGNWTPSNVTDMGRMFENAGAFDRSLGNWDIANVQYMTWMLSSSGLSTANYDATLIGWAAQTTLQPNVQLGADGLTYCEGADARQQLIDLGWDITGDQACVSMQPGAGNILYVDINVDTGAAGYTGAGDSWANAVPQLRDALGWAASNWDGGADGTLQVWVADGTYYPTGEETDRAASFRLVNNVAIYGGFAGEPSETALNQRNFKANPAELSGDINGDGALTGNAYHVVNGAGVNNSAVLDGFTVTGGNADGGADGGSGNREGGGLYANGGGPKIANTMFIGNYAAANGGGAVFSSAYGSVLKNVLFAGNEADEGGGLFAENSMITVINATFTGNTGRTRGGAIVSGWNGSLSLTNSILWDNVAGGSETSPSASYYNAGGGLPIAASLIANEGGEDPLFTDPAAADYTLQAGSPAIGTGDNVAYTEAGGDLVNDLDLAGNPRVHNQAAGGVIDIGAYEFQATVNTPPTAVMDGVAVEEDVPTTGNVLTNDSDAEADGLTASLVTATLNGTVVLNADGSFTYTPNDDYSGLDSLEYQVCDDGTPSLCDTAWVRFTIEGVNDVPVNNVPGNQVVNQGETLVFSAEKSNPVSVSDVDAGDEAIQVALTATDGLLTLSGTTGLGFVTGDGTGDGTMTFVGTVDDVNQALDGLEFVPASGYLGSAGLTIVSDDLGATGTGGAQTDSDDISIEVVDGSSPVVTSVDVPADGYYREGDILDFTVNFSEDITVNTENGAPYLEVIIGSVTVNADYQDSPGANSMAFSYTVQAEDEDLDGIALGSSLVLNGSTVSDMADNVVLPTLNNVASTDNVFVYSVRPTVTLSTESTSPVNGPFAVTAIFSEAVTGFTLDDISATNGTLSDLQTADNITYTFVATPAAGGAVQVSVPAGVAVNIGNNGNVESNTLQMQYQAVIPAVELHDLTAVYDGTEQAVAITGSLPEGASVTYEIAGEPGNGATDAGIYEVVAMIDGGADYEDMELTATLTITPLAITVTATDRTKVFGMDDPALIYTFTPELIGDDAFRGALVREEGDDVGDYAIMQGDLSAGDNYAITFEEGVLTITPAGYEDIALTDFMSTYDGTEHTLSLTGDLPEGASVAYEIDGVPGNGATDAGIYEVVAMIDGGDNYEDVELTAELTIAPLEITVTADNRTKVFGTADPALTYTAVPELVGDDAFTGALVREEGEDVGNYAIMQGDLSAGDNYAIIFESGTLAIVPGEYEGVTLADLSVAYDGTEHTLSLTGDLPEGASVAYEIDGVPGNGATDAGTYEVVAMIDGGDNYEDAELTAILTIERAVITGLRFEDTEYIYRGAEWEILLTGDLPEGAEVAYVNNRQEDVGEYEATATITGDNYEPLELRAVLTIVPLGITVTADDQTKVFGAADPELTYTVSPALVTGDTFTGALERGPGGDVGSYAITQGTLDAGDNYTIAYTGADFSITPKVLTVTANAGQGKVYGSADPVLAFAATGFALADDESILTGTLAREAGEDAGGYAIMLGTLDAGNNYTIAYAAADFTITPLGITVTADDQTKVFGAADPELTYTVSPALVAGDSFTGALTRGEGEAVGTYGITRGTLALSDNYTLTFEGAELEITPSAALDISFADGSFVYDGTAHSLAIEGELPEGVTVSYGNNSRTDVGSQGVTATVDGGANYGDLLLTATLTVTPAERTLDFPELGDKTYGDADFSGGATASSGEAITYTSDNPAVAEITEGGMIRITGAGEAEITATVPENGNYTGRPQVSRTLAVHRAVQVITFNAPAEVNRDAGGIQLDVGSSSGLPVTLRVDDGQVATLDGTTLNIHRLGTINITATQAGDGNHEAAEPVTVTVRVVDPASDFSVRVHPAVSPNGDGINEFLMVEGIKDYPENRVTVITRNGTVVYEAEGYDNNRVAFRGKGTGQLMLPAGTYFYIVEVKANGRWEHRKGYFVMRY